MDLLNIQAIVLFAAFISLVFWGYRLYGQGLQLTLGVYAKELISKKTQGRIRILTRGLLMGMLFQSIHVGAQFLFGLANARLIGFQKGVRLFLGILIAPLFLWLLIIYIPPIFSGVLLFASLLSVIVFAPLFSPLDSDSTSTFYLFAWQRIAEVFAGLGFILLAFFFLQYFFPYDVIKDASGSSVIPHLEIKSNIAFIQEFFRLWPAFFVIALIFGRSFILVALGLYLSTIGVWNLAASVAFVSAYFSSVAVLEQSSFNKSGDGGKEFIRFFLIWGLFLIAFDLVFLSLIFYFFDSLFSLNIEHISLPLSIVLYAFFRSVVCSIFYLFVIERRRGRRFYRWLQKISKTRHRTKPDRFFVIGRPTDLVPSLALVQVRTQLERLKTDVDNMMNTVKQYIIEGPSAPVLAEIKKLEDSTDHHYEDILTYVREVQINPLTPKQSLEAQVLTSLTFELEKITDYLDRMATICTDSEGQLFKSNQKSHDLFWELWDEVERYYKEVTSGIIHPVSVGRFDLRDVATVSRELKVSAQELREDSIKKAFEIGQDPLLAQNDSDMIEALRKIRGHSFNIFRQLHLLHTLS